MVVRGEGVTLKYLSQKIPSKINPQTGDSLDCSPVQLSSRSYPILSSLAFCIGSTFNTTQRTNYFKLTFGKFFYSYASLKHEIVTTGG